jgi:hypothetical protein
VRSLRRRRQEERARRLSCLREGRREDSPRPEQIRPKCKKLALYAASRSSCGFPLDPVRVPCLRATAKGFTCKITKCDAADDLSCSAYTNCLAAADTNADGAVAVTDSGQCVPFHDCSAQYAGRNARKDRYVNECFDSCGTGPNPSECFFGCDQANADLAMFADAGLAACEANRARSCADLHAINAQYCAALVLPTPSCSSCETEVCLTSCAMGADCDREMDDAYSVCVASSD